MSGRLLTVVLYPVYKMLLIMNQCAEVFNRHCPRCVGYVRNQYHQVREAFCIVLYTSNGTSSFWGGALRTVFSN